MPKTATRMLAENASEIVSSEAFGRYVAQIWGDLREEASRGMHDDETHKLARNDP